MDYSALDGSLIPLAPGDIAAGGMGGLPNALNGQVSDFQPYPVVACVLLHLHGSGTDFALTAYNQTPLDLPVSRCRPLNSLPSTAPQCEAEAGPQGGSGAVPERIAIALNGRQGRRVGCVMMGQGTEVEVLDMEADEDAVLEDEEDEEGEEEDVMDDQEHMDQDE
jgi:hypothetical protein